MGRTKKCPRCGNSKSWVIRRDKKRRTPVKDRPCYWA